MAEATTFRFGQFLILIGNGASPQLFEDYCGVTSKSFERTANMNDTNIPDCVAPDDPTWLGRDIISLSANMPFSGVAARESFLKFDDWFEAGESRDMRVELGDLAAWEGRGMLQNLNLVGERGSRVNFTATLVSDGQFVRAAT